MPIPTLVAITPPLGPTSGGDLVRLTGTDFSRQIAVRFGGVEASVVAVRESSGESIADVRTPAHEAEAVDVQLQNLDQAGGAIAGETAMLLGAYRFLRTSVVQEATLTRLVRKLLRALKRQVLANVSTSVSVDYDDSPEDGLRLIAMATVPSLVLSGPTLRENRFYSANEPQEDLVVGASGPEVVRRRPPYTVDLGFTITAASNRTVELLNLMAAVATFLNRNRWIELLRDPADPKSGLVRWEMDADGEFRTQLGGKDDVRTFTCGLVVRGFDVDEGLPLDLGAIVQEPEVDLTELGGGVLCR